MPFELNLFFMQEKICSKSTCIKAGQLQSLENFYKNYAQCKTCKKQYQSQFDKTPKGKVSNQLKCKKYSSTKKGKTSKSNRQLRYRETFDGRAITLFLGAKHRAMLANLEFTIDHDWVVEQFKNQNNRCLLTNIEFDFKTSKFHRNPIGPSLDRIDSNKGYTKSNTRLVCLWINNALNEFGEQISKEIMIKYLDKSST